MKPVFLHVPRTGGTSIERALKGRIDQGGHSALETVRRRYPTPLWEDVFKFGFVRNPWDRVFSYYYFTVSHLKPKRHREHVAAFREWVRARSDQLLKKTATRILLNPDGSIGVNYVGQFEHLERDYRDMLFRAGLGREHAPLPHENAGARPGRDWRDHYDDETRMIVAGLGAWEIVRFGYTFEDAEVSPAGPTPAPR